MCGTAMTTPKALEIKLEIAPKSLGILEKPHLSTAFGRHPSAPPTSPFVRYSETQPSQETIAAARAPHGPSLQRRDGKPPGATPGGSRSVGDRVGGRGATAGANSAICYRRGELTPRRRLAWRIARASFAMPARPVVIHTSA